MTRLAELRALLGRAPSGPWMAKAGHNEAADQWDVVDQNAAIICEWSTRDEAALIAAAVNALPALLDLIEDLAAKSPTTEAGLTCPLCGDFDRFIDGKFVAAEHKESCPWRRARELVMVPNVIGDEK